MRLSPKTFPPKAPRPDPALIRPGGPSSLAQATSAPRERTAPPNSGLAPLAGPIARRHTILDRRAKADIAAQGSPRRAGHPAEDPRRFHANQGLPQKPPIPRCKAFVKHVRICQHPAPSLRDRPCHTDAPQSPPAHLKPQLPGQISPRAPSQISLTEISSKAQVTNRKNNRSGITLTSRTPAKTAIAAGTDSTAAIFRFDRLSCPNA